MRSLVIDTSALLALGGGHKGMSGLVVQAAHASDVALAVPALSLLEAEEQRAGLAEHAGMLEVLDVVPLDFSAVTWCGPQMRTGVAGGTAHAACLAQPSVEWPEGRAVVTRDPSGYKNLGNVATIALR